MERVPQTQDVANYLTTQLSEGPPVRSQTLGGQGLYGVMKEEQTAVLNCVVLGLHSVAQTGQQLWPLLGNVKPGGLGDRDSQLDCDLVDWLGYCLD